MLTGGVTTYLLLLISRKSLGNPEFFNLSGESIKELNGLIKYFYQEAIFHLRL